MAKDLVIDTNILVYLENKDYQFHQHCKEFSECFTQSSFLLCIDEGFDIMESKNNSYIWYEYMKHLPTGSKGHTFLIELARQSRIIERPKEIKNVTVRKKITQSPIKKSDKIFLKIAFNSETKLLVTDEHEDFTIEIRNKFKKEAGVIILHSWETKYKMFPKVAV